MGVCRARDHGIIRHWTRCFKDARLLGIGWQGVFPDLQQKARLHFFEQLELEPIESFCSLTPRQLVLARIRVIVAVVHAEHGF